MGDEVLTYEKVIRTYVDHLLGSQYLLGPQDYWVIRRAFKIAGGRWEAIIRGSLPHNTILEEIIKVWGKTAPSEPKKI